MPIETVQLSKMLGLENMTGCTQVTERYTRAGEEWKRTITFDYSDGKTEEISPDEYEYQVPSLPGWELVVIETGEDEKPRPESIWRRPIVAWGFHHDHEGRIVAPVIAGANDISHTAAAAILAPDGRVLEYVPPSYHLKSTGPFRDAGFKSVEAWVDSLCDRYEGYENLTVRPL
jgi:hypothetical protein